MGRNAPSAPTPGIQAASRTQRKALNINLTAATTPACIGCLVGSDSGTSSSAITLTRNVLGKQPGIVSYPPSNLPETDTGMGPPGNPGCGGGCYYTPPHSSNGRDGGKTPATKLSATADPPTLLSDKDEHWKNNGGDYYGEYNAQKADEAAKKKKIDATAASTLSVHIWNPDDEALVELNSKNYGALTKLFMRPTLPFSVNYSGF